MNKKLYLTTLALFVACLFSFRTCQAQQMTVNTKQDLDAGRVKIDSLDNLLMKVLGERERIAQAIGVYKAKNEGLSAEFITELMNAIHKESLRIESDSTLMKH